MSLIITGPELRRLVAQSGTVVGKAAELHPILAYLHFAPGSSELANKAATIRAAGPAAHVEWAMGAGNIVTCAVRHEHLAKLAPLAGVRDRLVLNVSAGQMRVEMDQPAGPDEWDTVGSWNLPLASAADLAHFPDPPPTFAAWTDREGFDAGNLHAALVRASWAMADDGSVQIRQDCQLLTNTWSAAVSTLLERVSKAAAGTIVIPAPGARVLRAVLEPAMARAHQEPWSWSETDGWHHIRRVDNAVVVHLAKWSRPVEDVWSTFFGSPDVPAVSASTDLPSSVRRASALNGYVRVGTDPERSTLTLEAQDGSSHQEVAAELATDEKHSALLDAKLLLDACASLSPGVRLEFRSNVLVLSDVDAGTWVALVPLQDGQAS